MKKPLLFILFLSYFLSLSICNATEFGGFKGLKWGTSFTKSDLTQLLPLSLPELSPYQNDMSIYFDLKSHKLGSDNKILESTVYGFHEGSLVLGAILIFDDLPKFLQLKHLLESQYGLFSIKNNDEVIEYFFIELEETSLSGSYNLKTKRGYFLFTSKQYGESITKPIYEKFESQPQKNFSDIFNKRGY